MEKKKQRRQPGANARRQPQKAPHVRPRKNPAPAAEPVRTAQEVVYMAPKPFSRSRLILRLATVVAVVLAVLLGLSIFFKVGNIEVSGCSKYTAWEVQQASGIENGDQLLTIGIPKASAKIIQALPYVQSVRIGIRLPDTVQIEIVETQVCYSLEDSTGAWWLMNAQGKILEQCPAGQESAHTKIVGVNLQNPVVGEQAVAAEIPAATAGASETTLPVTVTGARRLETAVSIAAELEQNGIIGGVDIVDVTDLYDVQLQYGGRFAILLGETQDLDGKIGRLRGFLDTYEEEKPYEKGTLDLSDPENNTYVSQNGENEDE